MDKDLKETVSKILVKWNMPTRQVAIGEIIEAVKDECIDALPEEGKMPKYNENLEPEKIVYEVVALGMAIGWRNYREQAINNIKNL